jgi:hypothetical protein
VHPRRLTTSLAGARRGLELERHRLPPPGRLHPVDLLQLLDPALHLRRMGRPRLEALDELISLASMACWRSNCACCCFSLKARCCS